MAERYTDLGALSAPKYKDSERNEIKREVVPPIVTITAAVFPCCTTTDSHCFRKLMDLASPVTF